VLRLHAVLGEEPHTLEPQREFAEAASVHDFDWYPWVREDGAPPSMLCRPTRVAPSTCCFVTCSRDSPLHLWDVSSGTVRRPGRADA